MNSLDWSKLYGFSTQEKLGDIFSILKKQNKTIEDRKKIYKHHNFEDLARLLIAKIFEDKNWKATNWSKDNNHDAYTVISFYDGESSNEEWWIEAKYSINKSIKISRYKLDATIVSAILNNAFVSRIIFITNLNIKHKTVEDIRKALEKSTNCKNVDFFTKDILDYFLFENKDILKEYFDYNESEIEELRTDAHFSILSKADVHSKLTQNLLFKENDIDEIYVGDSYHAELGVFSSKQQDIILSEINDCIKIVNNKTIRLNKGFNYLNIDFLLLKYPNYKIDFLFKFDNYLISPSRPLKARKKCFFHEFKNHQDYIILMLHNFKKKNASFHIITGDSGIGKSTLIEQLISKLNNVFFYSTFTNTSFDNIKLLVKTIKFLLYPFIPSEQLDYEYLNSLNHSENLSLIAWLASIVKLINENNINSVIEMCKSFDYDFPHLS
jgi:hypothetical protein